MKLILAFVPSLVISNGLMICMRVCFRCGIFIKGLWLCFEVFFPSGLGARLVLGARFLVQSGFFIGADGLRFVGLGLAGVCFVFSAQGVWASPGPLGSSLALPDGAVGSVPFGFLLFSPGGLGFGWFAGLGPLLSLVACWAAGSWALILLKIAAAGLGFLSFILDEGWIEFLSSSPGGVGSAWVAELDSLGSMLFGWAAGFWALVLEDCGWSLLLGSLLF
ncbi:hypothetical protein OIU85_021981 [Salix viminalis]|uniref:Uncharacterized protein n=1 Tax=Salix viminalis TaxID=40686 RepID=A0A9Q0UJV2_SALVM|nr:hypothetical protein OIU85_021981 [Salix viminalis]